MENLTRRKFLQQTAATVAATAVLPSTLKAASGSKIKLGFDNFSVRAMNWKAGQLLEHAASLKVDTILFSDLFVYENHSDSYLRDLKKKANDLGVEILAGTGCICPSSTSYNSVKQWGTSEEHLRLTIRIAKTLGSNVARCYQGTAKDRSTPGGIEARNKDTVKVCKAVKSYAQDSGVKIAIENHAGDMQAWELQRLIEEAGKEYVGATIDCGNATWTLEDPLENLEILAPYAACAGIRDSMVWETPTGAAVKWMAMGEGVADMKTYIKRWTELCPHVPVTLEIISEYVKPQDYLKKDFWKIYPHVRPYEFGKWTALARNGKQVEGFKAPAGSKGQEALQEFQKSELARSVKYCKSDLGIGLKA